MAGVYFVQVRLENDICHNPIKIGRTDGDFVKRIENIQDGMPVLLQRGYSIKSKFAANHNNYNNTANSLQLERVLHDLFCAARLFGEWFQLDYGDVLSLCESLFTIKDIRQWFMSSAYKRECSFGEVHRHTVFKAIDEITEYIGYKQVPVTTSGSRFGGVPRKEELIDMCYFNDSYTLLDLQDEINGIVASRIKNTNIVINNSGYGGLFD